MRENPDDINTKHYSSLVYTLMPNIREVYQTGRVPTPTPFTVEKRYKGRVEFFIYYMKNKGRVDFVSDYY